MLVFMRFIQTAYQTLFCVNKMNFYSWEMIRFLIKNTKYRRFFANQYLYFDKMCLSGTFFAYGYQTDKIMIRIIK